MANHLDICGDDLCMRGRNGISKLSECAFLASEQACAWLCGELLFELTSVRIDMHVRDPSTDAHVRDPVEV